MGGTASKKQEDMESKSLKWNIEQFENKKPVKPEDYGYLAVPDTDLEWPQLESQKEKIWRKCKENPFVPVGLGVTVFALTRGILNMRGGTREVSQRMMRLRVCGQGFTVIALLIGVAYSAREKRLEREAKKAEREALATLVPKN